MKIAAIVCNLLVFAFVGMELMAEGVPASPHDVAFTIAALLIPFATAAVIFKFRWSAPKPVDGAIRAIIFAGNVLLLARTGWAVVARYPYSEGNGIISFAALMLVAPILSLIVISTSGTNPVRLSADSR